MTQTCSSSWWRDRRSRHHSHYQTFQNIRKRLQMVTWRSYLGTTLVRRAPKCAALSFHMLRCLFFALCCLRRCMRCYIKWLPDTQTMHMTYCHSCAAGAHRRAFATLSADCQLCTDPFSIFHQASVLPSRAARAPCYSFDCRHDAAPSILTVYPHSSPP